jgi:hypothetical protein
MFFRILKSLMIISTLCVAEESRLVASLSVSVSISDSFANAQQYGEPILPFNKFSWKSMGKGLSTTSMTLERFDSSSTAIRIVRFEKGKFKFSIIGEEGKGRPVDSWISEANHVAGINANYYYYKEKSIGKKTPLGMIIRDGKILYPWKENYSGCFYYNGKKAGILYKERPPANSIMACQSFPVVIYDGVIPDGVREKSGGKLDIQRKSRRSVIAEDRKGDLFFLVSLQNMSFQELGFVCGAIGISKALCLDGGSSTQYCVMDADTVIMSGLEWVPFVIGAQRK